MDIGAPMEMDRPARDRRPDALGSLSALPDELLSAIIDLLSARDIARLACVSSVLFIFCNEEPLWLRLCIQDGGSIEYKGTWKKTFLHRQKVCTDSSKSSKKPLQFDGFSSMFLYRRWYRCFTTLNGFSFNSDDIERRNTLTLQEFRTQFDGHKPVLLTELVNSWPARNTWTVELLVEKYGDISFRISQRSSKKITMEFRDYVSYMEVQHDEDPLYIFDSEFGDAAPCMLKDYDVPHLFKEDYFDVLDLEQRPSFRWLIIGPERSGASWHVDPGLTSAWNTLLVGRKRWALYPPGNVPAGVTVHVNDEDGDVNIDAPSSLQWWLDVYPLLADENKPLECTQLPGETIFVPSGWWHCVLNLETTIAITQNFVNAVNFEFVCLDLAPGHVHKGVSRAGLLAIPDVKRYPCRQEHDHNFQQLKKLKTAPDSKSYRLTNLSIDVNINSEDVQFSYDSNYLSTFLDPERDHYNSLWSLSNYIGQREMRTWLHKLWVTKPDIRQMLWKGACYALNVDKWSEYVSEICSSHSLPLPSENERLPVGTGSNPVFVISDYVIKIFVEGGLECSLRGLGTELQFYKLLYETRSPLQEHIPQILASGILIHVNDHLETRHWDGIGLPNIPYCDVAFKNIQKNDISFTVWTRLLLLCKKIDPSPTTRTWPYLITKRCEGEIFANVRDIISKDDALELASFLGCQLKELHLLPVPTLCNAINIDAAVDSREALNDLDVLFKSTHFGSSFCSIPLHVPVEYLASVSVLHNRRKGLTDRLCTWGSPIPKYLIDKVHEYIPDDISLVLNMFKDTNGFYRISGVLTWLHMDIMDDNIIMKPKSICNFSEESSSRTPKDESITKWSPGHILDFSDLLIGDPIYDIIPIYLDIFRGNSSLLKKLLESYELPLLNRNYKEMDSSLAKFSRLSYRAMCFCLLHEENVVGAIFSLWKELRLAKSWEEVEETVWGSLNSYCCT